MMKVIAFILVFVGCAFAAQAQQAAFRKDTTGGFKGVYCIGPLDRYEGPMIVLDHRTITYDEYKKIDEKNIEKVMVYKNDMALSLFGHAGINGAIVITSKKKEKTKAKR